MDESNGSGTGRFRFSPGPNRAGEIEWRGWGREAFAEAGAAGRLVLLSISAVWCHWCHVMDETTYSDPRIIEAINRDFIPVRVDSDMRPDVNRRYNQGGWPTTAFLVPSGRVVAGLTYAPPEQLLALLGRLAAVYGARRDDVEVDAAAQGAGERSALEKLRAAGEIDNDAPTYVAEAILEEWDRGFGGMGEGMKFPPFAALEFALQRFVDTGDASLRSFVISTLDGMVNGGLEDRVEGGFFRYATCRDWSEPHYEKMLDDNARMAYLYLAASVALERPDYAETARRTLDYALANLLDDERRGFFGSQDADEKYYHRDAAGRAGIKTPPVDRTIYVDSTSAMLSALSYASAVLEDRDLLELAGGAADHAWHNGFRHPLGVCHYFDPEDGSAILWGQAADQVAFLGALLDIYQATGEAATLERATELADVITAAYVDGPGWLVEARAEAGNGGVLDDLPVDTPDVAVNARAARAFLLLEALSPGSGYGEAAQRILLALGGTYRGYGHFAGGYALAVDLRERGPVEVRLDGGTPGEVSGELRKAALAAFNTRKLIKPATVEDFMPEDGAQTPPAVLCTPGTCVPVFSVDDIRRALGGGLAEHAGRGA
ncbi:MAG: DUF255 domain-containing protein [Actinobacteria bacterium]|nr:DUF255 domain-containing protein [Actinomycetota bacterium]